MQLKIRRSQKTTGMLSKSVTFMLDARVELTNEEAGAVSKYKLGGQCIYNSANSQKHLAAADAAAGPVGALIALAKHRLSLNIHVNDLYQGQHIECKDLDELLGAEQAVRDACAMLRRYLDTAMCFDGSEEVIPYASAHAPMEPDLLPPPYPSAEASFA